MFLINAVKGAGPDIWNPSSSYIRVRVRVGVKVRIRVFVVNCKWYFEPALTLNLDLTLNLVPNLNP